MREIFLILERIGLRQDAAVGVPKQTDLTQAERLADGFAIFHHVFHGVLRDVIQFFGFAGAAFVNEDEPVMPRQRQQVGQEIIVRGARAAVDDHQRRAASDLPVIDEHAMGVHETIADGIDIRGFRLGFGGRLSEQRNGNEKKQRQNAQDFHARNGKRAAEQWQVFSETEFEPQSQAGSPATAREVPE